MLDVPSILKKTAEQAGFTRTRYKEAAIPTSMSKVILMLYLGDLRSTFVLSSLLLRRFREELRGSKYFVLASWPGNEVLFPYVDEYWAIQDQMVAVNLYREAVGFINKSNGYVSIKKNFNYWIDDNIGAEELLPFYERGLKQEFFEKFGDVKRFLPMVSSVATLGPEFNGKMARFSGAKILFYPMQFVSGWKNGREVQIRVPKEFWISLIKLLRDQGMASVVCQNYMTYDLSDVDCVDLRGHDVSRVLAAMRASDCVLDLFSGTSRLALAARAPFVLVEERGKYNFLKEYEVDDLCSEGLPRQYIFGFSTIIEGGEDAWKLNLYDNITAKLNSFLPRLDRNNWPSTSEVYEVVPYERVRERKSKKLGTKFIKVGE